MNRIPPALFAAAFTDWVRETWPETPDLVAIDGKTSRRSHDRKAGQPPLTAERAAHAVRDHWAIENSLHWVLDVTFKEEQSRLRKGHGAQNMAVVRHFALNLIRSVPGKQSLKLRRKRAGWDTAFLNHILKSEQR